MNFIIFKNPLASEFEVSNRIKIKKIIRLTSEKHSTKIVDRAFVIGKTLCLWLRTFLTNILKNLLHKFSAN